MEALKELVAASFARHGIECPAGNSQFVWGVAPPPVQPERGPATAGAHSSPEFALDQAVRSAEPILITALPEHNYRRNSQERCP